MNFLRSTYFKKTSAVIFISLFVFVHVVKALHTHEISIVYSQQSCNKSDATVKADFSCSICDFQIAKDSDASTSNIQFITPERCIVLFSTYILPEYNSIVGSSSGTDPPSLA